MQNTINNKTILKNPVLIVIILIIGYYFVYGDFIYFALNYKHWYIESPVHMVSDQNVGGIVNQRMSPFQQFTTPSDKDIRGISLRISTYKKAIDNSVYLDLYQGDCQTKIEEIEIQRIIDNQKKIIPFRNNLERNTNYCFNISNKNSLPITIWCSSHDITDRTIVSDKEICEKDDIAFGLIDRFFFK